MLFFGIVFFVYVILGNWNVKPIWQSFPDSKDYKLQSECSILSIDFFCPKPTDSFAPRPFTIPLVYKIAQANPYWMVMIQKMILFKCNHFNPYNFKSFIK